MPRPATIVRGTMILLTLAIVPIGCLGAPPAPGAKQSEIDAYNKRAGDLQKKIDAVKNGAEVVTTATGYGWLNPLLEAGAGAVAAALGVQHVTNGLPGTDRRKVLAAARAAHGRAARATEAHLAATVSQAPPPLEKAPSAPTAAP